MEVILIAECLVFSVLVLLYLHRNLTSTRFNFFDPIVYMLLMILYISVARPITLAVTGFEFYLDWGISDSDMYTVYAALYFHFFTIVYILGIEVLKKTRGYRIVSVNDLPYYESVYNKRAVYAIVLIYVSLSLVGVISYLSKFSTTSGLFGYFIEAIYNGRGGMSGVSIFIKSSYAIAVASMLMLIYKGRWSFSVIFLSILTISIMLVYYARANVILFILSMLSIYSLTINKISLKKYAIIVAIVLFFLIYWIQMRSWFAGGMNTQLSMGFSSALFDRFLFGADISGFDYFALMLYARDVLGYDYEYLRSLLSLGSFYIPSSLWDDKPKVIQFYFSEFMLSRGYEVAHSPGLTYFGSIFLNGGVVLASSIVFLLGMFHGWISYSLVNTRKSLKTKIIMLSIASSMFFMFRATLASSFINIIEYGVFVVPIFLFVSYKKNTINVVIAGKDNSISELGYNVGYVK
jgi:oligosaccharide repeat unit polymerase